MLDIAIDLNQITILILILAIAWLVLIIIAIYDITRNTTSSLFVKVLWFIIILSAPLLGSIIYLIWGKNKKF